MIKAFSQRGVVVYLNAKTKQRYGSLSPLVLSKFSSGELGRYIPKVVVSSSDQTKIFGALKYKSINKSSANNLATKMKRMAQGKTAAPAQNYSRSMPWPSRKKLGSVWSGSFQSLDSTHLVLNSPEGVKRVPLSNLTPAAINCAKYIAKRKGGTRNLKATNNVISRRKSVTPITKGNYFRPLTWTNKQNQSMLATLVSLDGNILKVRLANGEVRSCKLGELTRDSILQARREAAKFK